VRYTRNGTTLYAHFLEWPAGDVRIDGLHPGAASSVTLLGYDGPIDWRADGDAVVITPPLMSPREMPIPYAWVFKLSAVLD